MWDLLNDPEVLARITPGVDTLEQTGPGQYQAVLHIKMGPINSTFNGVLQVVDSKEPESYRLLIDVDGKIGQIAAEGHVPAHRPRSRDDHGGSRGRLAVDGSVGEHGPAPALGRGADVYQSVFQGAGTRITLIRFNRRWLCQ